MQRPISPSFERVAAYAWRFVAVAAAVAVLVWLAAQLLIVVVPLAVGGLIARALWPINRALRNRGAKPGLAAFASMLVFVVALGGVVGLVGVAFAGDVDQLGPTLETGIDDVTDWLVDDSPFDVSRQDVENFRAEAGERLSEFVRSGSGGLVSGAVVAVEIAAGMLLSLIIAFFVLKDGRRWADALLERFQQSRREQASTAMERGWSGAGGYLRGAAALGGVEAIVIGIAMFAVGSSLVLPTMVITFLAAFVPIVGAVIAGVIASLVVLVTVGTVPALIVAGVAFVVQQLDNDLLAPWIYGKAVRLHPLVVLLGIAGGGALFGFVGTLFAVPLLAVSLNAIDGWRNDGEQPSEG